MGAKLFRIGLSMLLCLTIIPVLQGEHAWAVENNVQENDIGQEEENFNQNPGTEPEDSEEPEEQSTDIEENESESFLTEEELSDLGIETNTDEISQSIDVSGENLSLNISENQGVVTQASTYSVTYKAHVAYVGWQNWVKDGAQAGTVGKSRSIEAIQFKLAGTGYSGAIEYRTHVSNVGWQAYVKNGVTSGTTGKSQQIEAVSIKLTGEIANHYDVYYRVHSAYLGWLGWTSNGVDAGTSGYGYGAEAIEVKLYPKNAGPANSTASFKKKPMTLEAKAHVSNVGWQGWTEQIAGTTGRSLALEALCLRVSSSDYNGSIQYRTHVQNVGWQGWKSNGTMAGSTGKSQQVESMQVKLTGDLAKNYDVYYRVHASHIGWLGWAKNGETAGIPGYSSRVEAVQVKLVKKDSVAPGSTANHTVSLDYSSQGHSANIGWLNKGSGARIVGTTGRSQALEAFKIWIDNSSVSGSVEYKSHVGFIGWQNYVKNGTLSGSEGQNRQLEAVQIRLTGDLSKYFDIYYRAHVSGWGWLGWAKNGAKAGTTKNGIAMEAVQIKVVAKGAPAPGSTSGSYWETEPIPATYRAMNTKVSGLSSPTGWLIAIDSKNCLVGVYSGSAGNWKNRYMWLCSPGAASTPTVKGIYSIGSRGYVFGSGYSCYWWTQFYGDYLFHSVLYYPGTNRIMEGTMGVPASHGCVRLDIANAKWIHDKIPSGTTVLSY